MQFGDVVPKACNQVAERGPKLGRGGLRFFWPLRGQKFLDQLMDRGVDRGISPERFNVASPTN